MNKLPRGGRKNYTLYLTDEEKALIKKAAQRLECTESYLIVTMVQQLEHTETANDQTVSEDIQTSPPAEVQDEVGQGATPDNSEGVGPPVQRNYQLPPQPTPGEVSQSFEQAIHEAPRQEVKDLPVPPSNVEPRPGPPIERPQMQSTQDLVNQAGGFHMQQDSNVRNPNPSAGAFRGAHTHGAGWQDRLHQEVHTDRQESAGGLTALQERILAQRKAKAEMEASNGGVQDPEGPQNRGPEPSQEG